METRCCPIHFSLHVLVRALHGSIIEVCIDFSGGNEAICLSFLTCLSEVEEIYLPLERCINTPHCMFVCMHDSVVKWTLNLIRPYFFLLFILLPLGTLHNCIGNPYIKPAGCIFSASGLYVPGAKLYSRRGYWFFCFLKFYSVFPVKE